MFYEAINLDLIVKNPFDKIKMVYRSKEKTPCLTINQVKQIIECDAIANNPDLLYYRDLFLFGCFTGLSCISIINLASNVLFPIFNNRIKLDTLRDKTGKLIVQIIPAPAQRIMEKYSNLRQHGQAKVFPTFCNETFNIKLKEIAAHAGLNINLTTKISRTTCNQIVVNTGQFDLIYKRAYMGWSNSNDIQDVYTTLVDDVLLQNTLRLEAYLMNNIGNDLLINL
jgi:integrase